MTELRVFVVEDDPLTASLHGEYVRRVPGFTLVGTAHSRKDAVAALLPDGPRADPARRPPADLVLLDMNLPDGHGLAICRMLRAAGAGVDVLAITAATEVAVVREAIALGVVQYLIKPFGFAAFEEKLSAYAAFRSALATGVEGGTTQDAVDAALGRLRSPGATAAPAAPNRRAGLRNDTGRTGHGPDDATHTDAARDAGGTVDSAAGSSAGAGADGPADGEVAGRTVGGTTDRGISDSSSPAAGGDDPGAARRTTPPSTTVGPPGRSSASTLPKGLSEPTLAQVCALLAASPDPLSAFEVHAGTGISRVTARRYLEYLATIGQVARQPRYGSPGRPEMGYRWHP